MLNLQDQLNFIKLKIVNHFIKNYAKYSALFHIFSIFAYCYCFYKSLQAPGITYNSGPPTGSGLFNGMPELGPDPFSSIVQSIQSGQTVRRPLPCTHYTELTPGLYEVTGGGSIEIYKKDSASPTKLVGIHIPDHSDPQGNNPTRRLGASQVGGALFELREKGVSSLTRGNTKNTPEIHEYVRAHAELGGLTPGAGVSITHRLINDFVDVQIPK